MKKIFSFAFLLSLATLGSGADWWMMPTICQPDDTECYPSWTGAGIDMDEWDIGASCKGKKLVCENAIKNLALGPALSKAEISDRSVIDEDFDISVLHPAGNCFGVRKTRNNGTQAKVGTEWRNVYCPGVLDNPDDVTMNGEIMLGINDQPTCRDLADIGRIGILNGQCYGSTPIYQPQDFYLECDGANLLPTRIVVLNGAAPNTNENSQTFPATEEDAQALFKKMIENAAKQQQFYAGNDG